MEGQIDFKGRPLAGRAVHPDVSIALFHDAVDRGETEARALTTFLGGEKGFENVSENRKVHPCPRVGHGKAYVISRAGTWMRSRVVLIEVRI